MGKNKELKLWKVSHVANYLAVSERSVWRYLKDGKIPKPVKYGKGCTRWLADDFSLSIRQRVNGG